MRLPLKLSRLYLAIAATFVLLVGTTTAQDIDMARAERLPKQHLFDAFGRSGQSMDSFAYAIAPRLRAFSEATGFEACGIIARAPDGRYALSVITVGSHLACVLDPAVRPAGSTPTGYGIHSHGRASQQTVLNPADMVLSGLSREDDPSGLRQYLYGQSVNTFSQLDLEGLPGYLATETGAIFHDARGRVRVVHAESASVDGVPASAPPSTVHQPTGVDPRQDNRTDGSSVATRTRTLAPRR